MSQLNYICNCVNWPKNDVNSEGGLVEMIDNGIEVSRKEFISAVNRDYLNELESSFGYSSSATNGMTIENDHHVRYFRSELHGSNVYFINHSAIEYVFA